jgi:hypothetical protein
MNPIEALLFPDNDLDEEKAKVFLSLCDVYVPRESMNAYYRKIENLTFTARDLNLILTKVHSNESAGLFFEESAANILGKSSDRKVKIDCAFYIVELSQHDLYNFVKPRQDTRLKGTHQRVFPGNGLQSMKRSASSASHLNNVDMKQPSHTSTSANFLHSCLKGLKACCYFQRCSVTCGMPSEAL